MDLKIEFVGIKEIAGFLGLLWNTFARCLREGKIVAASTDCLGRWVHSHLNYYRILKDVREAVKNVPGA